MIDTKARPDTVKVAAAEYSMLPARQIHGDIEDLFGMSSNGLLEKTASFGIPEVDQKNLTPFGKRVLKKHMPNYGPNALIDDLDVEEALMSYAPNKLNTDRLKADMFKTASAPVPQQDYPDADPHARLIEAWHIMEKTAEKALDASQRNQHMTKEAMDQLAHHVCQDLLSGGNIGAIAQAMNSVGDADQIKVALAGVMPTIVAKGIDPLKLQAESIRYEMEKGASIRTVNLENPIVATFATLTKLAEGQQVLDQAYQSANGLYLEADVLVKEALNPLRMAQAAGKAVSSGVKAFKAGGSTAAKSKRMMDTGSTAAGGFKGRVTEAVGKAKETFKAAPKNKTQAAVQKVDATPKPPPAPKATPSGTPTTASPAGAPAPTPKTTAPATPPKKPAPTEVRGTPGEQVKATARATPEPPGETFTPAQVSTREAAAAEKARLKEKGKFRPGLGFGLAGGMGAAGVLGTGGQPAPAPYRG